jgi:hypothetical protein
LRRSEREGQWCQEMARSILVRDIPKHIPPPRILAEIRKRNGVAASQQCRTGLGETFFLTTTMAYTLGGVDSIRLLMKASTISTLRLAG